MSEHGCRIYRVPPVDTGIGQSLGFDSDAAFLEHQRAEEAQLDPEVREALEAARRATWKAFLLGE